MRDVRSFIDVWKKYMYILTPAHKCWGVVVFICSLLGAISELLGVSVILPLVQAMLNIEELKKNVIIDKIIKFLNLKYDNQILLIIIILVIIVYILKNIFLFLVTYIRTKYTFKVKRELSIKMIYSYISKGYNFFRTNNIAVLLRGCSDSIGEFTDIIFAFFSMISDILLILCIFTFMVRLDYIMAFGVIGVAIICFLLIIIMFRKRMQVAGKSAFEKKAICTKWLHQIFYGIKELLVMNKVDVFVQHYEDAYSARQKAEVKQSIASSSPTFIIEGVCVSGIMLALGIRLFSIEDATTYVATLAAFAVGAFRILPSVGRLSANFNYIVFRTFYVTEVYESMIVANELEEKNNENAITNASKDFKKKFDKELLIKDVSYHYPDGDEYVLDDVTINIKKGESVALVGPSGAGKTTLADIILGLFTPQKGRVYVDGIDIFEHKEIWSNIVSFVPQDVYLIDDSIRRNVCFGVLDQDIDDKKVWRALEQAQMKEYVENLKDGLDTVIGDRGIRFSGGQSQRLAIARALYNDPDILVLDEATSALDNETETAVMEAIDALQGQKTMIIIAHRLTTIKNCDHIYEIKDGKATERKYEELI